eukprot:COSAG01_NODE_6029_length_3890_cov_13.018992_2_plen_228_part_00
MGLLTGAEALFRPSGAVLRVLALLAAAAAALWPHRHAAHWVLRLGFVAAVALAYPRTRALLHQVSGVAPAIFLPSAITRAIFLPIEGPATLSEASVCAQEALAIRAQLLGAVAAVTGDAVAGDHPRPGAAAAAPLREHAPSVAARGVGESSLVHRSVEAWRWCGPRRRPYSCDLHGRARQQPERSNAGCPSHNGVGRTRAMRCTCTWRCQRRRWICKVGAVFQILFA